MIVADDEEDDEIMQDTGSSDEEGSDQDDEIEAMETVLSNGDSPSQMDKTAASTTFSLLSSLTRPLLALSHPTTLSFPPPASAPTHSPTTSILGRIHVHALECLNNLFISLNADEVDLPEGSAKEAAGIWNEVWSVLGGSVRKQSEWEVGAGVETRKEMWEVGAGVLWGLARIAKEELVGFVNMLALCLALTICPILW